MKIPITKNLSTDVLDLVGYLDVSSETAEQLSRLLLAGATITLHAAVVANEKPFLKQVSFGIAGTPASFPPRSCRPKTTSPTEPRSIEIVESSP